MEPGEDHARPLTARGRRQAGDVGCLLRREALTPDRILTSTAARAQATARIVAESAGFEGVVVRDRGLYLVGPLDCLRRIGEQAATATALLVVAHNPGLEELVQLLCGEQIGLSPAALAAVETPVDAWSELWPGVPARLVGRFGPGTG